MGVPTGQEPHFFASADEFRNWLQEHHGSEREVLVGYHKKETGKPTMTWSDSVDQALCFGWIDGIRRKYDESSYTIRFTPRKAKSTWSAVNIAKYEQLEQAGLIEPAGREAFERRTEDNSRVYSYDRVDPATLNAQEVRLFTSQRSAWEWFQGQAPSYRRAAIHWVESAKRDATREKRLQTLIECSAAGVRIPPMRRN